MDKEFLKEAANMSDDHLEIIISDVLMGGYDTVNSALQWFIIYLLHWPHIQEEVYKEIIEVFGRDGYPTLQDRSRLPLVQATIQETLRLSSTAPMGGRKTTKSTSVNGHNVPIGTEVFFNVWAVNRDPKKWDEPDNFNPRRWLDGDGKYSAGKDQSFAAFSFGKRSCIGAGLARGELFIFATRIIRCFKVEANTDEVFPSVNGNFGGVLAPNPYTAKFTPREVISNIAG